MDSGGLSRTIFFIFLGIIGIILTVGFWWLIIFLIIKMVKKSNKKRDDAIIDFVSKHKKKNKLEKEKTNLMNKKINIKTGGFNNKNQ